LELQIDKLVYGGDGMARLPADERGRGKTVFLPFVIPGERVDATISESRSGFARARLNKVITPSSARVDADCPHFGRCGGCHYQHISYEAQLQFKAEILRETLRRTAKLELTCDIVPHGAQPWHYRNRTRMRIEHTPAFALGYFRANSHDLLAVESCPISSPLINRGIAAVWKLSRDGEVPVEVHGVQFFANHDDSKMLVEGYVRPQSDLAAAQKFAETLMTELDAVAGVALFATSPVEDDSRQHAPFTSIHDEEATVIGDGYLTYEVAGHRYRVSAGSFFQTNRFLIDELVETAIGGAQGVLALDLFCGAGLFTLPFAAKLKEVVAVEASRHAIADLQYNAPANVKAVRATTETFLLQQAGRLKPDFVLLDPPRAGLGEKASAALARTEAPMVTLVSCDPATLSRDLRPLLDNGFRVQQAHLFDLFPQTAHIETVLQLTR
jgi:23S rRNA (uracil1939-C5)-methyltransferase